MENDDKYSIAPAPSWAKSISNEEIIDLITMDGNAGQSADGDKRINVCYVNRRILNTSNYNNKDYSLFVYRLDWPEVLQGAAVSDYFLLNNQRIVFHRLGVIHARQF